MRSIIPYPITVAIFLIFFTHHAQAQSEAGGSWEDISRRLERLEKHLGIKPAAEEQLSQEEMYRRLEALERKVFGTEDEPAVESSGEAQLIVTPPPESSADVQWQEWNQENPPMEALEHEERGSGLVSDYPEYLSNPLGLNINGYGMVSFLYDEQRDISTFRANVFELDFTMRLADWATFTSDLVYINEGLDPIYPLFRHPGYDSGGGSGAYGAGTIGGDDDDDLFIEQLYVRMNSSADLFWVLGKFNTPVGIERRTPNLRYTVQPSLIFPLMPRDLTGVMMTYEVNDYFALTPLIYNGWDLDENNNNSFTYALRGSYQITEDLQLAATVSYGAPYPSNDDDQALIVDAELRYTGIPDLLAALEYLYVNSEVEQVYVYDQWGAYRRFPGRDDISYQGFLALVHYDFTRLFGLTVQSSLVDDPDGFNWSAGSTLWEFSIIPTLYFTDDLELRLQYQHIESDVSMTFMQRDPARRSLASSNDLILLSLLWSF
ncbi:MAG: outer membrane beta-barrel protein [bacterium]